MHYVFNDVGSFYICKPTSRDILAAGVMSYFKCVTIVKYGKLDEKPFPVIHVRIHKMFTNPTECLVYLSQQYLIDFRRYKHKNTHQQLILQVLI